MTIATVSSCSSPKSRQRLRFILANFKSRLSHTGLGAPSQFQTSSTVRADVFLHSSSLTPCLYNLHRLVPIFPDYFQCRPVAVNIFSPILIYMFAACVAMARREVTASLLLASLSLSGKCSILALVLQSHHSLRYMNKTECEDDHGDGGTQTR